MMHVWKQLLKRLPWVYSWNAWMKSRAVKRAYRTTVQLYQNRSRPCDENATGIRRVLPSGSADISSRRIFFLGTDEQQDRSGIIQALGRLGELTYFTRTDGSYGQNYPGSEQDRRRTNSERLRQLFAGLEANGKLPHILIAQTWAGFVDPKLLGEIRDRFGTLIVNIGMDDRHQYWGRQVGAEWWGTRGLIPYLDLALTAAPECVEWYEKEGCPARFFPEASDSDIFHPMPELPKIHDVCFVGGRYGIREKIVQALRNAGVRVTSYGAGWEGGRLENTDVPKLFAQSKIVLGIGTVGHCSDFYALKMRDFDGPMSGSLYLTHDNVDLYSLFEIGKEMVTYSSSLDCVEKVKRYLYDDRAREAIASAGRARAVRDHTWDKRFQSLLSWLSVTSSKK